MTSVLSILVGNAIAAALIAVLVLLVTRIWRNPHFAHALWLLVLLKLVIPPIVQVPVFRSQSSHLAPRDGEPSSIKPHRTPQAIETTPPESIAAPPPDQLPHGGASEVEVRPETQPSTATHGPVSPATVPGTRPASSDADNEPAAAMMQPDPQGWNFSDSALLVWLAGSTLVAILVIARAIRFGRAVHSMLPASTHLQDAANELAAQLKLRTHPSVRLTTADLAPLIWSGMRRPTIVLPARLAATLSELEIRTILVHELAHLARRDHWVRWLEVVVTILYWWHPAVWLARREIRRCEDICCDAYVPRLLPESERAYAGAMLRAASLPLRPPSVPVLASSFGRTSSLKRRIEMVLNRATPAALTRKVRVVLIAMAVSVLAVSAGFAPSEDQANQADETSTKNAAEEKPQAAEAVAEPAVAAEAGGFEVEVRQSTARSMDFSSDGTRLVGACADGVVRVWDARLGYPIHLLTGHAAPPGAVVVTPDNASIVSASYDGELIWWDLQSGELLNRVRLQRGDNAANPLGKRFFSPVFTQDASRLVTRGQNDDTLYIWDVESGSLVRTIALAPIGTPYGLSVSHDGGSITVLTSPEPGILRRVTASVWDVSTGEIRFAHEMEGWSGTLAISPDGNRLAVILAGGVQVLDTNSGDVIRTVSSRPRSVQTLSFSPDGRILAVGGEGTEVQETSSFQWRRRTTSEVQVWDLETGRRVVSDGSIDGSTIWSLAFTDDSRHLARCDDKRIVIQDTSRGEHRSVIPIRPPTIGQRAADRTEELVYILSQEKAARHEQWLAVVRELEKIGKPAVQPLARELDEADDSASLRLLGFALRAVGEPEAVPALIRAIPKTLQDRGSDLGLGVDDPDLEAFAQLHDLDIGDRDGFGLGRPVREIGGALVKLTGVDLGIEELYSVRLVGGPRQQALQRELYDRVMHRWQAWWRENWRNYLDDPAIAGVDASLAAADLFPTGPHVMEHRVVGAVVQSIHESERNAFLDFDTGHKPNWPEGILRPESKLSELPAAVEDWAAREGVDFIGTEVRPQGSDEWFYCLRGLDLMAWEIGNDRWETIRDEIRRVGPLELGRPVEDGHLMHFDETTGQYDPAVPATFLFITREGARGILQTMGQVRRILGPNDPAPAMQEFLKSDLGFQKGIRIQHALIYEKVD